MIMKTLAVPFRLFAFVLRRIGVFRLALVAAGATIAALVTPVTGPELRRRIGVWIARRRSGAEPTVEERVRERLAENPRTWHLPQPEVVAVRGEDEIGWQIILAGEVADESARIDLELTARAVTGVADVDNRIRVVRAEA